MVKTKTKKKPIAAANTKRAVIISAKRKSSSDTPSRAESSAWEKDNIYLLKLVLFLILGSQWVRVTKGTIIFPIPIGLIIGLFFAKTEKYSFDRKIEYAILLLSMFIGYWLPIGLEIVL